MFAQNKVVRKTSLLRLFLQLFNILRNASVTSVTDMLAKVFTVKMSFCKF